MSYQLVAATLTGKTHVEVGSLTYCGRIVNQKWHYFDFGGPPDCLLCNRTIEADKRERVIPDQRRKSAA